MADTVRMCRISWNWIMVRKRLRGIVPVPSVYICTIFLILPLVVPKVDNDNVCEVFFFANGIAQPRLAEHMCRFVLFGSFCSGFLIHSQYVLMFFSVLSSAIDCLSLSLSFLFLSLPLSRPVSRCRLLYIPYIIFLARQMPKFVLKRKKVFVCPLYC